MVEEVVAAGFEAHLAEPADTQAARGRQRHAKTDRSDSRLLRELLADGRLPASWIAPAIVLEWRERIRLYKTLVDERSTWVQQIHADLYQHGVTLPETSIRGAKTRAMLEADDVELSAAGRQRVLTAYRMIDAITLESRPLKADLQRFGHRQPGCRALADSQYGIGGLLAVAMWSELGDCQRFARSEQVVRHSGLDVTVDQSDVDALAGSCLVGDRRRCAGRSPRQPRTRRITAASTTTTTPMSRAGSPRRYGHNGSPAPPCRYPPERTASKAARRIDRDGAFVPTLTTLTRRPRRRHEPTNDSPRLDDADKPASTKLSGDSARHERSTV